MKLNLNFPLWKKSFPVLENAGMICSVGLDKEELQAIRSYNFLTLKPTMYIANVNEDGFENNPYLDRVREIAEKGRCCCSCMCGD